MIARRRSAREVREAQLGKVSWMLVLGLREAEADEALVRHFQAGADSASDDAFAGEAATVVREGSALKETPEICAQAGTTRRMPGTSSKSVSKEQIASSS